MKCFLLIKVTVVTVSLHLNKTLAKTRGKSLQHVYQWLQLISYLLEMSKKFTVQALWLCDVPSFYYFISPHSHPSNASREASPCFYNSFSHSSRHEQTFSEWISKIRLHTFQWFGVCLLCKEGQHEAPDLTFKLGHWNPILSWERMWTSPFKGFLFVCVFFHKAG